MKSFYQSTITTPIGLMTAVADSDQLHLLEFCDRKNLEEELDHLSTTGSIAPGSSRVLESIQTELQQYFAGTLQQFKTPFATIGSPFQKQVWEELLNIPFGETKAYSQVADRIGKPTAFRAAANAVGANQLAIIVPCHRVIHVDGGLGGYAGGIDRKKALLAHEKRLL